MVDLAPHGVDLLATLLGDEWQDLVAFKQRRVHDYAVDDGAVLAGRFRGGTVASIHVAYNCPDHFPRRTLELIGTRAMVRATDTMGQTPGGSLTLIEASSGRPIAVPVDPADDRNPFEIQARAFADAILDRPALSVLARARPAAFRAPGGGMPLTHLSCTHCGFWHLWFEGQQPTSLNCVLCSDVRNALPPDGWDYADLARVAGSVRTLWKEFTPGIWGFWCEPRYGLAGTGWLILRDDGNVAFEGAPFYHDEALGSDRASRWDQDFGGVASAWLWRDLAASGAVPSPS